MNLLYFWTLEKDTYRVRMSKSFESSMDNDIGFPKNSRVKVRLATLSYSLLFYIP